VTPNLVKINYRTSWECFKKSLNLIIKTKTIPTPSFQITTLQETREMTNKPSSTQNLLLINQVLGLDLTQIMVV